MKEAVNIFYTILQLLFISIGLYYFVTSIFGLAEKIYSKPGKNYLPMNKFALFIPGHNEEVVIENIVTNLQQLNYPRDSYDIFVIADNCTDNTAKVAAKAGAKVLERFDSSKRGKGFAVQWAFEKVLYAEGSDYDAAAIFDADNLVSKNFLKEMNNKLCEGHKVVQGYIDSKNPEDSWITASYSIAFWSANRMFQCARSFMGLSCEIGGTGFCVDVKVLKQIGWQATCLVEDLEFTMKLNLNNIKVAWANDAVVYDEKPLTLAQSWHQRKRWMQGFADVNARYFWKLLLKGIKDRDLALIDCAIYTLQPYVLIVSGFMLTIPLVNLLFMDNDLFILTTAIMPTFFKIYGITQFALIPLALSYDKKLSYRTFLLYPIYILYCLTWIPIAALGIIDMNKKEWSHTAHTRSVSIGEIE